MSASFSNELCCSAGACEPLHDERRVRSQIQVGTPRASTNALAKQNRIQPGSGWFAAAGCRRTRAPAFRTQHPSGRSTKGRRRKTRPARCRQRAPGQGAGCHSSGSSCSSRKAFSSRNTQCQAFKQPIIRPINISISVQEYADGWCSSNQTPSATPSRVGIVTDHPISPDIPKPNQMLRVALRWAFSLRAACADPSAEGRLVSRDIRPLFFIHVEIP